MRSEARAPGSSGLLRDAQQLVARHLGRPAAVVSPVAPCNSKHGTFSVFKGREAEEANGLRKPVPRTYTVHRAYNSDVLYEQNQYRHRRPRGWKAKGPGGFRDEAPSGEGHPFDGGRPRDAGAQLCLARYPTRTEGSPPPRRVTGPTGWTWRPASPSRWRGRSRPRPARRRSKTATER